MQKLTPEQIQALKNFLYVIIGRQNVCVYDHTDMSIPDRLVNSFFDYHQSEDLTALEEKELYTKARLWMEKRMAGFRELFAPAEG